MTKIIIDGRLFKTKKRDHEFIAEKLSFPSFYGENVEALHDMLSSYGKPTLIRIRYAESITDNLGKYGETLLRVFDEAGKENKIIKVEIE